MKALLINSVCGVGSTGRICVDIAHELECSGYQVKIAYGRDSRVPKNAQKYAVRIGNDACVKIDVLRTRFFDCAGFGLERETDAFLKWADEYKPDLIWLHNIHGYYINVERLFNWLKQKNNIEIRWTLHDCWAFTGHCTYFTMCGCNRWIDGCFKCPQKRNYPASYLIDASERNYKKKRELFTGVTNMELITPSKWLADLVKQSYLKDYPVVVSYNKIDKQVFKPTLSDFRMRYGINNEYVILGVASPWDERKGMKDFFYLLENIRDAVIVLVGLTEKQIENLPKGIIGITRTNNAQELAEIYTAADVFVNPTYEDNYPTVNLEAEACGTPVVTYLTGGSPETLHMIESCAVETGNLIELAHAVEKRRYVKKDAHRNR